MLSPQNDFPEWTSLLQLNSESEEKKALSDNSIYVHDVTGNTCYSISWSLNKLIENGISVKNKISVHSAADFESALQQIATTISCIQNECSGIQTIQSFDTLLAPYIKNSNLTDKEIFQLLQNFLYTINIHSQSLCPQSCIHIGFDWTCPAHLKSKKAIIGTSIQDYTYRECQAEMDMLNKGFLAVMEQGDRSGRAFLYTIPEYAVDENFNWNNKNTVSLLKVTEKYGLSLFRNKKTLVNTPSLLIKSAVALNLPVLAYRASSETAFFENLETLLTTIRKILSNRKFRADFSEQFLDFDYYSNDLLIPFGLNETCMNLINESIVSPAGKVLSEKILKYIKDNTSFLIARNYMHPLNFLFANKDLELYEGIKHSGTSCAYYSSGTNFPADAEFELFTAIKHHEQFAKYYSETSPLCLYTGNQINDWQTYKSIIKRITTQHNIPYFTFSPLYSICPEHGYFSGSHVTCPICNMQTEQYTRTAESFQLLDNFSEIQKEEILRKNPLSTETQPSLFQDFTYELFTSKNCKKCPSVQQYISKKNIQGTEICVDTKKGLNIAAERGVFMTPTVIFYTAENKEAARIHTVDEIDAFLSYQGISTGASSSSALLS